METTTPTPCDTCLFFVGGFCVSPSDGEAPGHEECCEFAPRDEEDEA